MVNKFESVIIESPRDVVYPFDKEVFEDIGIFYHGTSSIYSERIEERGFTTDDMSRFRIDLYINFLSYRQQLGARFMELRSPALRMNENLSTNLIYGSAVYRLCYYRQPQALPVAGDVESHAAFWKQHYNTPFRPGTVSKYAYKAQKVLKL